MELWTLSAALLNLSGLSAGYLLLRRWRRALVHLALTGGLIGLAFASGASSDPGFWKVVAGGWLLWMAVDGWRQARFQSLYAPAPSRVPLAVGAVLLLLVPVGFGQYRAVGASTFERGLEAHRAGDCEAAISRYRKVSSVYELTLSPNVLAADANIRECDAYLAAERAQTAGNFEEAIDRYHRYQKVYPDGSLRAAARSHVAEAYSGWGAHLREAGEYNRAITMYGEFLEEFGEADLGPQIVDGLADAHAGLGRQLRQRGEYDAALANYQSFLGQFGESAPASKIRNEMAATHVDHASALRERAGGQSAADAVSSYRQAVDEFAVVLRDFGDTPAAAPVGQSLLDTYDRGVGQLAPAGVCGVVDLLDVFLAATVDPVTSVVAKAREAHPQALYDCGLEEHRNGDDAGAVETLHELANTYPSSPLVAQAEPTLIAATIGMVKGGSTSELPPPQAVGGNAPAGSVIIDIINDSPEALEILVNGPVARLAKVGACATCTDSFVQPLFCPKEPRPTTRLQLPAGRYDVVVQATSSRGVTPFSGVWDLKSGSRYTSCLFVVTSFWLGR